MSLLGSIEQVRRFAGTRCPGFGDQIREVCDAAERAMKRETGLPSGRDESKAIVYDSLRCVEVEGREPIREIQSYARACDYIVDGAATWNSRLIYGSVTVDIERLLPLKLGKKYRLTIEEEKE